MRDPRKPSGSDAHGGYLGHHSTVLYVLNEMELDAFIAQAKRCGIDPGRDTHALEAPGLLVTQAGSVQMEVWPMAFASCACGWSRPARDRMLARSAAFVHRMALGKA